VVNQWAGGFQGEVTVTAGAARVNGWTVRWTFPGGQAVTQLWNGTYTASGASVTVRNLSYNGTLGAGTSTTFGFLGTGSAGNAIPAAITCTTP
jgi:cellulase/cellobiase CelA1